MVDPWQSCAWACGKCDKTYPDVEAAEICCSGYKIVRTQKFFASCFGDRETRGIPAKAPNTCGHRHKTETAATVCGDLLYGKNPASAEEANRTRTPFRYHVIRTWDSRKVRL